MLVGNQRTNGWRYLLTVRKFKSPKEAVIVHQLILEEHVRYVYNVYMDNDVINTTLFCFKLVI